MTGASASVTSTASSRLSPAADDLIASRYQRSKIEGPPAPSASVGFHLRAIAGSPAETIGTRLGYPGALVGPSDSGGSRKQNDAMDAAVTRFVISFLTLISVAVAAKLLFGDVVPLVFRRLRRQPAADGAPAGPGVAGDALADSTPVARTKWAGFVWETFVLVPTITVLITLAIVLVMRWTGVFESFYFRPSVRDYGQQTKLAIDYEDVTFHSADGTRLHGWWIPAKGDRVATVVHFHGSDRNITYTVRNVHWLTASGFDVFVFDYRGYGRSAGRPSHADLVADGVAAIQYARERIGEAGRLCLWGQSMGGQLAIVATDQAGRQGVRAIVAEATYARHTLHIADKLSAMGPLWMLQWAAFLAASDTHSAEPVVGRLEDIALLFVHGTQDRGVFPYHSDRLFGAADGAREIWRIDGGRHLDAFRDETQRTRLVDYLRRTLDVDGH